MAPSAGFPADALQSQDPVMPNNSPIDYLIVFATIFAAGAIMSTCFGKYVDKVRREATQHA
jgi:hypothetical protein